MLELKAITKTYQAKRVKVEALKGITLTLPERGMTFIVGKSGSGKSSLLNILGGLDAPTSGDMVVDGTSVKMFKAKEYDAYRNDYVGFVFQEYNLIDSLTVAENVELALNLHGEKDREAVERVLSRVELEGYGERKVSTLSGGQKQRVAIARALIKEPKLLIADEPTGALDSETGAKLFLLLKELSKEILVVVVSHDLDFAREYGDRIIELSDGKIVNDSGEPEKKEAKATTVTFQKKKTLTFGKTVKLGLKGVKKNPIRFAISMVLCAIALVMFGVGMMMSQYYHVRVLSETLLAYDDGVVLRNDGDIHFTTAEMEEITSKYPGIRFKQIYDGSYGAKNYDDIVLQNYWNCDLPEMYYQASVNAFCEIGEAEIKQYGFEIVAGKIPTQDGEVAVPLYLYEQLAEVTNRDLYEEERVPCVKNYNDLLGKALNENEESLVVVGIVDTKIDLKYESLKNYTYDDYSVEKEKAKRDLAEDFSRMARDSIQFCCYLPEGYFGRHLSSGLKYINSLVGNNCLEILRDQGRDDLPAVYESIERFISYKDLSEADRTHIYAPGLDETKKLEVDEAIVSFELLCRGNYQINQLYTDKFRELIREYAKGQIDVLLNDPQFMSDYEAAQVQISPENFYEENLSPYGKYYDTNPYGTAGIELDKDAQRAVFDLFAQSASQFTFYDRKDGQEKIVTKKLVGIFPDHLNYSKRLICLSDPEYVSQYEPYKTKTIESIYADISDCGIEELTRFVEEYETGDQVSPYFDNQFVAKMSLVDEFATVFGGWGYLLGMVFIIFSVLMIFNFISSNVRDRKAEIGVLRALGAGMGDTVRIFLTEALLITLLTSAITLGLLLIAVPIFNNQFVSLVGLAMRVVSMNYKVVLSVVGIALASALLAFLIPLIHIAKMKPIDAIRKE